MVCYLLGTLPGYSVLVWAPHASRNGRSRVGMQVPGSSSGILFLPSAQGSGKTSDSRRVQALLLLILLWMIIRIIILKETGL